MGPWVSMYLHTRLLYFLLWVWEQVGPAKASGQEAAGLVQPGLCLGNT